MTTENQIASNENSLKIWQESAVLQEDENRTTYFARVTTTNSKILYGFINQNTNGLVSSLHIPFTHEAGYYPYPDRGRKSENEIIRRIQLFCNHNKRVIDWTKSPSQLYEALGTVWIDRNDPDSIANHVDGGVANRRLLIFNEANEIDLQTLISRIEERNPWKIEPITEKELESLK